MGLSGNHHGELNNVNVDFNRYDELRRQYAGDKVALQQIDVYDPRTQYHDKLSEFVEALKAGNEKSAQKLAGWLNKNYPDI